MQRECAVEEALEGFKRLFTALDAVTASDWLDLEMTMAQWKGMLALQQQGALTVGEFADALRIGQPAASILAGQLVKLGLAERSEDPADRRRTILSASGQGAELVEELRRGRRATIVEWVARLDDADLAALVGGLHALATVADEAVATLDTSDAE
jgi:DNA-binding MarR family transcriptional regulator